jgi:hypothetical protein
MEEIIALGAFFWLGFSLERLIRYKRLKRKITWPLVNVVLSFLLLAAAIWVIIIVSRSSG